MRVYTISKNLLIIIFLFAALVKAQDMADPLRMQGLDQFNYIGAYQRSLAGSNIAQSNDVSSIYLNPALLSSLEKGQVKVGASYFSTSYNQTQQWTPNRFYAELSLMMENKDTWNEGAPYEKMAPDWSKKQSAFRPSIIAAAYPVAFQDYKITAAIAYTDFIDLDHYFQNNNAMDPNIGTMRPVPYPRMNSGDTMRVAWYQFERERKGNIYGITPAVSFSMSNNLSLGVSYTILKGKSDDFEYRNYRASLLLGYNNLMRIDGTNFYNSKSGQSDYTGNMLNVGLSYNMDYLSFGVNLRPAFTIKRTWNYTGSKIDTSNVTSFTESGSDKIEMPFLLNLGVTIHPSKKVNVSVGYDVRKISDAKYTTAADSSFNPYVNSNLFKAGVEYLLSKVFALRAGYRANIQSFVPAGAAILTDPASGSVYSAGVGIKYASFKVDIAYEYSTLDYQDMWLSNVNFNTRNRHSVTVEAGYEF
jgi:long-subunit fatty acid transport protein